MGKCLRVFGVVLVLVVVAALVSCADVVGSNGSADGSSGSDVDPSGRWVVVLDDATEGPTGVDFRAALAEVDDTQFTIVFYGDNTAQVAGLRGNYEVDGDSVDCLMNIGWFPENPEDPTDPDAPELKETWDGVDWYEVVEGDGMELSVTIDGETLYGGGDGEIEFEKMSFSRPLDLLDHWVDSGNDLELHSGGSFTYTYDTQTGGGDRWEATLGEGYLRQICNEISDESHIACMEFLTPYEMVDNGDTLRMYEKFALSEGISWDYTRSDE